MPIEPTPPPDGNRPLAAAARRLVLDRLGNRLRTARIENNLTQAQAAEVVGTTAQTVRNWETARNEPPRWAITKLAERYNVTVESLLDDLSSPLAPPSRQPGFPYDRVPVSGTKLSQARREAGLTQTNVAFMTGLNISAIRRYERELSNPPTRTLQILATLYGRPAGWFTSKGYFTSEEQQRFDAAATLRLDEESQIDPVLATYTMVKDYLPGDAKRRIAEFIGFIHRRNLLSSSPQTSQSPEPLPDSHHSSDS